MSNSKSKQIKSLLVNLASDDSLPTDLNYLDESIFDHLFEEKKKVFVFSTNDIVDYVTEEKDLEVFIKNYDLQPDQTDFWPDDIFLAEKVLINIIDGVADVVACPKDVEVVFVN